MNVDRRSVLVGSTALLASSAAVTLPATAAARIDGIVVLGGDVSNPTRKYVGTLRSAGVDLWCYNGPETVRDFADTLSFLDANADGIVLARSVGDIAAAKRSGKVAMVLGWQNSKSIDEAYGSEWRYANPPRTTLRAFYEMGLRIANIAYNLGNAFGGGNLDPAQPLTREGVFLVQQMQEMGILVDCGGHSGEQTSLDVARIAKKPVICTHSNVRALNDNPRNTSDRVIRAIASTGGVFGLTAVDAFLSWGAKDVAAGINPHARRTRIADIRRYVDEMDYLMELVGPDHIGLGPDFLEGYNEPGAPSFSVDPDSNFQYPRDMTYAQGRVQYVKGFESAAEIGNVRAELVRRGYSALNISKIMGANWMRVYAAAWRS